MTTMSEDLRKYVNGKRGSTGFGKPGDLTKVTGRGRGSFLLAARSGLYILVVIMVVLGAGAYSLRKYGIFKCSASGYGSNAYLGYCGATSYGDYDHGAMWFDLEPAASAAAASAQVLFIGNSRIQFAFSSQATTDWFASLSESYYLLGFSHFENYTFEAPLLHNLRPKAKVYVINIDSFFELSETGPGKTVMRDESAKTRYEQKRLWQGIHKPVCTTFKAFCGNGLAIFRSRPTGTWHVTGWQIESQPVTYNDGVDQSIVATYTALGNQFLPSLPVDHGCTILTIVPTVNTGVGTAKAIAGILGFNLVAPKLAGLSTIDHVHLGPESAQRWSAAFFEEAGPQIRKCLGEYPESHVAMSGAAVSNN
jgi:hypothetical protein